MRTKHVKNDELDCLLMALMPENRLACEVSLRTGLRIGDVLNMKTDQLTKAKISIRESKTGKLRRFTLPGSLRDELIRASGKIYVFEHRLDYRQHRTRQTVFKDVQRVAKALRLGNGVAPHSMRKVFAVRKYHATGNLKKVQELLNHSSEAVTMLYALADEIGKRAGRK